MDDLIRRQDAIDALDCMDCTEEVLRSLPSAQPEVIACGDGELKSVDTVEVVRCKDCKYSKHWYGNASRCFLWHENGIKVFNVGYCSYGKRRE